MQFIVILIFVSFSFGQRHDGKIVGGDVADIRDYPYQASILNSGYPRCGGSIITLDWILTSAQCIYDLTFKHISVRVGTTHFNSEGVVHKVVKVVIHKRFSDLTYDYDIGLLKLNSSITAENTQTVKLPPPGHGPPVGTMLTVTGWGDLNEEGDIAECLQMVQVPVVNSKNCSRIYANVLRLTDRMFCAGFWEGGKDGCEGDAGSPAVFEGVQYGIVSWGRGCARPRYSGVYANVPELVWWIQSEICPPDCDAFPQTSIFST